MSRFKEGNLVFNFPDDWIVGKYDNWSFYKNQFEQIKGGGVKAVDFIAITPARIFWLIEVKDYRINQRTKPSDLSLEMAEKVFDTIAGILPAKLNSSIPEENNMAEKALKSVKIRIVLHLEQPVKNSTLFPRIIDPAHVQLKLRQLLKPIDPHPLVREKNNLNNLGWKVI